MIQANELRRNNYILRKDIGNNQDRYEKVLELIKNKVCTTGPIKVISDYEDIYPIPLTEETLLKCGFFKGILQIQDTFVCIKYMFNKFPLVLDIGGQRCVLYEIEYLHQLQNLYFALTGKELEIKL